MPNAENRLLLISYVFPPAGGVAVQRALSLARYLPENGFSVHVLCCRNPGVPTMDPSLLDRIPADVCVHRVASPEVPFAVRKRVWAILDALGARGKSGSTSASTPKEKREGKSFFGRAMQGLMRRAFCPDPEVVWGPLATRKARQIIREEKIDTLMVTAPPFSSFLLGLRLKREFPHLRFIADFRDEWLGYYLNTFPFFGGEHMRRTAERIERQVADRADRIVAVTPAVQALMRNRYPDLPASKFGLIPNGYDPQAVAGFHPRSRPNHEKTVVIGYAGTLHKTSRPDAYFDALDTLPEELRDRIETRIIGRVTEEQAPHLVGRKTVIVQKGFLPQDQVFRELEEVDYLLLIEHHGPTLPGKLFEYLAMGKPILAVGPSSGEVSRILRETGAGHSAPAEDANAMRVMLESAVILKLKNEAFSPPASSRTLIDRYSRRNLAREYSELIRAIEP